MRIKDYPQVSLDKLSEGDVVPLDGTKGTRCIAISELSSGSGETPPAPDIPENIITEDNLISSLSFDIRKFIWGGNNLGESITSNQLYEISNGTFNGLHLGDYWENPNYVGVQFRIADFDYWLPNITNKKHHIVITAAPNNLVKLNDSMSSTNGYFNSPFKTNTSLQYSIKGMVNSVFGPTHLLQYKESYTNKVDSNGIVTGRVQDRSCVIEMANEVMIFGSFINGENGVWSLTSDKQMLGFACHYDKLIQYYSECWLRDPVRGEAATWCMIKDGHSYKDTGISTYKPLVCFGITG